MQSLPIYAVVCVIAAAASSSLAAADNNVEPVGVLELTESTFDNAIAKYDHILVDFYAPWCGHCKRLSPELDVAAAGLAQGTPPIIIAKVNADKYTKLGSRYSISGYPTLKLFINGFPIDYTGPRRADLLSSHLQKLVHPDVKVVANKTELREFLQDTNNSFPIFVAFGLPKSIFSDFAQRFKIRAWFVVVESFLEDAMNEFDFDKSPAIVALRRSHHEQEIYYGPFDGADMLEFVQQNLLPRVNFLSSESIQQVREDGRPIAVAILKDTSSEQSVAFIKILKAAAPANRAFIFSYVDALKWPSFVENFQVDKNSLLPTVVIWDGDSSFYVSGEGYNYGGEKAESYVSFFLQDYKNGKAIKREFRGPSFLEFLRSMISMRSVYIIIFIFGLLAMAHFIWSSSEDSMKDLQTTSSKQSCEETSSPATPFSGNKED